MVKYRKKIKDNGLWEQIENNPEFQMLLNSMSEGIVVQEQEGKIIQYNPAALKILGLTEDELLGRTSMDPNWKSIKEDGSPFPGEEHPAMVSLRTGKPVLDVTMGLNLPSGELRWIKINAVSIFTKNKRKVLSNFTDITSQFNMNEELDYISKSLKDLFFVKNKNVKDRKEIIFQNKEIFNFINNNSILYVTDINGIIININQNFEKISGYKKEELIGENFEKINSNMHPKEFFREMWETILSGKTWFGDIYNNRKDTSLFVINTKIFPLKNSSGKIIHFLAFSSDITEKALNAIRLTEAQKIAKIGSWEFNIENSAQFWSEEHYKIFEIPKDQPKEKLYELYRSRIHPDDLATLDYYMQRALNEGLGFVYNHRVWLENGKRIKYVQGIARVVKDKNDKPKYLLGTCQDRTEFIKIQEENKLVLKMLKIGIWKYSLTEKRFYWDESMFNLYEISPSEFEGTFPEWLKLIKSDSKKVESDFNSALESKIEYNSVLEIKVNFAKRKFIGNRAVLTEINASSNQFLYGISCDNSSISLNENIIYEQKTLIENIFYNIPCMIFVKDYKNDLRFKIFNKAGEDLLGVPSNEIIGKTDYDFFPKEQADFFTDKDKQTFISKKVEEIPKEEINTKLGKRWLRTFKIPTYDANGNPSLLIGVSFDITNELIQQDKLKRLLDENIAILKSTNLSVITTDLKGIITGFNEESERILDYNSNEVIGKVNILQFFDQNEIKLFADNSNEEKVDSFSLLIKDANKGIYTEKQISYLSRSKNPTQVKLAISSLKNNENVIYGYMAIAKDMTNELLIQNKLDEERVKAVHNSKLISLGELSAGIMHEINNPLSIIAASVQLLKKSHDVPVQFANKCEQIEKAMSRILKIVSGLKRFSRSTENDLHELLYLSDIIREVLIITEGKVKYNSVDLKLNVVSEGKIVGDFVELEQVLINLINNAADAIKNLSEKWITLNLFNDGGEVVLQIIDSGNGVPKDLQEKIFNPFFTTKPKGEGTGLGLSISKSIIERHHGKLLINSNFKNTCFELRFKKAVYNE